MLQMTTCEAPGSMLGFIWKRDQLGSGTCRAEGDSPLFSDFVAREINALSWLFLILITSLLLGKVIRLVRLWANGSKIPGPPCPSLYGHLKLISGANSGGNLIDFLSKSHEKYGSIVRLWLGPTQLLVSLNDPELIKEMLVKAEDKLPLTGRTFRLAFGRLSLFVPSFEKAQKRRQSLAMQLNGKLLDRANMITLKVVDSVMERIHSLMPKEVLDCRSVSQHMAFSILGSMLFGDAFFAWSDAIVYEDLLMMIAKDAYLWASYSVPPFWKTGFWRYQCLCRRLKNLTQDIVQLCRETCKFFGQMDQNHHDERAHIGKEVAKGAISYSGGLLADDLFLEELNGHFITRDEPCGNIMGMMFHGCLTMAGLIANILTRLVMHPDIQDKIYSEIIMMRRESSNPELQNVDKMHFLLATVYESARLLPAGPLLQRCSLKHDLKLKTGITVPAGTILVVPVQLVQIDDSCWGSDASQFNPYRFLSKVVKTGDSMPKMPCTGAAKDLAGAGDGSFVVNDPNANEAFLPFGSGARVCVGQKLAIRGISTLFTSLLEQYEVRLQPGTENDPKPTMNNCVLQLLPSPKIIFVRRTKVRK
ncbi:PREDICTED: cytochrome P450 734A1-like [Nelumbo nucifera]|uniref:Cytochrome P450 734A1-like n=1 Tax=Nelumbo nucifera TaxID=4432 RepID=A0A1U7ZB17_NELNU|nr:PREDICTED: cytochrome P450 734A1-like [Nelumbo nucifera]